MKKLLIIALGCYGLSAAAQQQPAGNYLYLYSDSVVQAERIRLRADFYGSLHLRVDSRRVPAAQVKFFSNEEGFFGNTRRLNLGGVSSFSERIVEGKLNLYQQQAYDVDLSGEFGRYRRPVPQRVDTRMYYNKGFEDLKRVNSINLMHDMADSPESQELLKRYQRKVSTSRVMYGVAGAAIIGGLASFLISGSKSVGSFDSRMPSFGASYALLGIGAGFALGGYAVGASAGRHLEDAVDHYNRR
ncbi:hypothetical protein [Pedobacter sp. SYP-B3415]|uniref:hypothetical protein n=1 Tax=Pedobacter sp. SYP-B3415 TaxID=2496641 RepID=UPI00101BB6A7|nr:hypothetical protein [Pedobacter sp. SYP-B3415]